MRDLYEDADNEQGTHLTETPTSSCFFLQWDTSELKASISKLRPGKSIQSSSNDCVIDVHDMEDADKPGQAEEPRVRLDEHPLDFVHLGATRGALLFRSFLEAVSHGGK